MPGATVAPFFSLDAPDIIQHGTANASPDFHGWMSQTVKKGYLFSE